MPKQSRRAKANVPDRRKAIQRAFVNLSAKQYRQTGSEHSLQASVMEYLRFNMHPHAFVFAIPNAGKRSWQTAAKMKAEGLTAGVADICIMRPGGRVAWLELKIDNEKQSPEQIAFEQTCQRLGHVYCIARTFEDAIEILRRLGALKENAK